MLRRMYEDVQEPFLNATTTGAGAATDLGSNPFAALLGNQGGGDQTGDESNRSTTGSETTTGAAAPNTNPLPNPWNNSSEGSLTNSASRANPTAVPDHLTLLGYESLVFRNGSAQ
ncbi:Hypothetical predicted protein [Olea europaea subsp. europaea]|uniref:Uncharacterized protein n=1 Tax=Olea europaea subsp. europaea TaxID=158383 RepID=A0A8S0RFC4_OLEEU|nr:Hypothetical predicted protein [Olea europaea subsp. europaea]